MVKLASSLHTIAKFEVIRYPFDVTVIGEALGCDIDTGTRARPPSIITHPFETNPDKLQIPVDLFATG